MNDEQWLAYQRALVKSEARGWQNISRAHHRVNRWRHIPTGVTLSSDMPPQDVPTRSKVEAFNQDYDPRWLSYSEAACELGVSFDDIVEYVQKQRAQLAKNDQLKWADGAFRIRRDAIAKDQIKHNDNH